MKKNKSVAVAAMDNMLLFLSQAEKDWGELADDLHASGMPSTAAIMEAKSDAMTSAKREAKLLLDWIRREESRK